MTCPQSFYRAPLLRPSSSDVTTVELASEDDRIKVAPYWLHHPSFIPPSSSRYSFPNDAGSVGWDGGPTTARIFFRHDYGGGRVPPANQGAYCLCTANALTTFVRGSRNSSLITTTDSNALIREPAAGEVTIRAFFYDPAHLEQRDSGIFLRMRSVVSVVKVDQVSLTNYGQLVYSNYEATLRPGTFVGRYVIGPLDQPDQYDRYSMFGRPSPSVIHNGAPSSLSACVESASLFTNRPSFYFDGSYARTQPRRGRSYLQTSHIFEFGQIIGGSLVIRQTIVQLDASDRYLSLGMDRRSAFASVASREGWVSSGSSLAYLRWSAGMPAPFRTLSNWFIPRVCFTPIVVNQEVADDFPHNPTTDGLEKHPLRFEIETTPANQSVFASADAGSMAEGFIQVPNLTATPWEGREVHDIRARVATSTAASRSTSFADHEQFMFMTAMTDAAAYRSSEVSYWPGSQPQTDIAIPIGSTAGSQLLNAGLKIELTADQTAKTQMESNRSAAISQMRDYARTSSFIPRWPSQVQLGGSYSGIPSVSSDFDSVVDSSGRSKYKLTTDAIAEAAPTAIGHFGDVSVTLQQRDSSGNATIGQWYCHEDKSTKTATLSTGTDPQSFTTTFTLSTRDVLWPEWDDKLFSSDVTDWNTVWGPGDVGTGYGLKAGIDRPYTPFTNHNSITKFEVDYIRGFEYYGENLTRYHYVDTFEATKNSNDDLIGIPPGPDVNGVPFTTRWTQAKQQFRDAIYALWNRCCDFSESIDVRAYSELDSVEARAEFVVSAVQRATQESHAEYPSWKRLMLGANTTATRTGVVTASDPEIYFMIRGNVRDVTEISVYGATASFGTPQETVRQGDQWRDAVGLRKTPTSRTYSIPCTVTFFTNLKTAAKRFEFLRTVGTNTLVYSGFAVSSDSGSIYLKNSAAANDATGLRTLGATSYSVSWA